MSLVAWTIGTMTTGFERQPQPNHNRLSLANYSPLSPKRVFPHFSYRLHRNSPHPSRWANTPLGGLANTPRQVDKTQTNTSHLILYHYRYTDKGWGTGVIHLGGLVRL